jgi:hypothetical protein
MSGSTRVGLAIAALVALGFLGFSFFGTRHESWFVRAAQHNAVRCLTKAACTRLIPGGGIITKARPPLGEFSACARRENWQQLKSTSNGQTRIVLTCTDSATYLYHMGTLPGRAAGNEQWMQCAQPSCESEGKDILRMASGH